MYICKVVNNEKTEIMKTGFEKTIVELKKSKSRSLSFEYCDFVQLQRDALNNIKNQNELNLFFDYSSSIVKVQHLGDIQMRKMLIESFKIQFNLN
jgi:hypothetical protein